MAVAPQPSWLQTHWPYLLGALLLHVAVAGLFGLTMIQMQRNAPPPTLAIQAIIVDQNQLAKPQRTLQQDRERARKEAEAKAAAEAQRKQEEETATKREQDAKTEQERLETAKRQERVRQEQVVRERAEQERVAKQKAADEQRALERKQQEAAERERKLEAEKQAKAEADRKRVAEIERKQREREEADRRRAAEENEARESALREQLAAEEGAMQARNSGAMNQYAAAIQQHVERQWNRPPSARSGIECEINVTQSPNGAVLRVQVGTCNGDQAVRQSIENAVQRASPLPLPSDMRLFDRNLRFIFKPAD
jgi:colicin import membrane protein